MHSVLMDDACILKTHVFMQRWCDIAIVVFIIKSPHLAYSVDNRQHSTSATLNIGLNIGFSEHRNNRPSEQSAKCNIGQALHYQHHFHLMKRWYCTDYEIQQHCNNEKQKRTATKMLIQNILLQKPMAHAVFLLVRVQK